MKRLAINALLLLVSTPALAQVATRGTFSTTCPASGKATGDVTLNNFLPYTPLIGGYSVSAPDCGKSLNFTISSPANVNLPTAASVGAGFYLSGIANAMTAVGGSVAGSTANLTLCVSASNTCSPLTSGVTINGATKYFLPPGSWISLVSDGTNWQITGGLGDDIVLLTTVGAFTGASGWVPNPGLIWADMACIGSGGGGGGGATVAPSTAVLGGGGGGTGGSKAARFTAVEINSRLVSGGVAYTISAGGAGGAGNPAGSVANGASAPLAGTTYTQLGTNPNQILLCYNGGGGGGAGASGGAGGGGGGYGNNGNGGTATANTNTGGTGGVGGGAAGATSGAAGIYPALGCAGGGGATGGIVGGSTGGVPNGGLCAGAGGGGAGMNASNAQFVGGGGGAVVSFAQSQNTGNGGSVGGGNGGAGTQGLADGLLPFIGIGIAAGTGGAGGGSNDTLAGGPLSDGGGGNGGVGGYGAGGGGGGSCSAAAGACTGGQGGAGGQGAIEIWEHNR